MQRERAQLKSVTKVLIERAMSVTGSQAKQTHTHTHTHQHVLKSARPIQLL